MRHTWITETVTMASSAATPDPLLISVKAVDPTAYPFYGTVKLDPPRPLREALDAQAVVVSDDLLLRLNVRTGDIAPHRRPGFPHRRRGRSPSPTA